MPKIVNHQHRREEIADSVLQLVARDGFNAVTMRAVAKESGWSTGVIGHYFEDRHDMLIAALRRAAYLQAAQFKSTRTNSNNPLDRLEKLVISVLPLDDRRVALTKIFLFFYAEAVQDETSREEVAEYLQNWRRVITRTLAEAQSLGLMSAATNPDTAAFHIVAYADGLASQAILDPDVLERMRANPEPFINVVLDSIKR